MYILKFNLLINWFYVLLLSLLLTIISSTDCNDSFSRNSLNKLIRSKRQLDTEITNPNNNNNNNNNKGSLVKTNKTTTNNTNVIGIKRSKDSSRKSSKLNLFYLFKNIYMIIKLLSRCLKIIILNI
jgi:hypothetical protein